MAGARQDLQLRADPYGERGAARVMSNDEQVRPRTGRVVERGAIIGARWRFLAEASTVLDRSLDYKETLTNVVQLVVPRMADYAAIALLGDDGSMTWGFSAHCDPAKEVLVGQLRAYQPQLTTK